MARIEQYRGYVRDLINYFASIKPSQGAIDMEAVTDLEHDHYQVISVGWDKNNKRVHHSIMHIDIRNNKIWIQENNTDVDIATQLVERGVAKEDIVLAFHPPYIRPYTGFGVN
jgi:hypothetical protein